MKNLVWAARGRCQRRNRGQRSSPRAIFAPRAANDVAESPALAVNLDAFGASALSDCLGFNAWANAKLDIGIVYVHARIFRLVFGTCL